MNHQELKESICRMLDSIQGLPALRAIYRLVQMYFLVQEYVLRQK